MFPESVVYATVPWAREERIPLPRMRTSGEPENGGDFGQDRGGRGTRETRGDTRGTLRRHELTDLFYLG